MNKQALIIRIEKYDISNILKYISLSLLAALLMIFFQKIISFVIASNLELSKGNLVALTFIYWIELLCVLSIYNLVITKIYISIRYYLKRLGQWAVRMKNVRIALFTIRLNHYLRRLSNLLRLGRLSYGSGEKSSVWIGLSKLSLSQLVLRLFRFFFSIPMVLAFLLACFSLKIFVGDINYYLLKIQGFLKDISELKINISDIFSRLPTFVALTTIVPIVFFFYFYSQKRDVRKIIDKENSKYFEEVVLLYEQLLIWIDHNIYKISENFDYVINCQDLITEEFLKKIVPNYTSLTDKRYNTHKEIESFRFVEIADLTELREIITKLSSDRLIKFTRIFSIKRFDVWYLYLWNFHLLNEEKKIEESFYTKKGISTKFDRLHTSPYDFTQEQIEKSRKEELSIFSRSIYDNLELLYRLKRASDSLRKYIYSSRTERLILKALNKDK